MNRLNLQYLGFLNTPNLWLKDSAFSIKQFKIIPKVLALKDLDEHKLRLGKLVERFVSQQLKQDKSITIVTENLQIRDDKLTIGEIDCLFKQNNQPIHLEIVYKFYLYDETVGVSEIDHWIGPNRKDSLKQKIAKLKEKQLPLLYHNLTKTALENLELKVEDIQQRVCFKAQLFVPWNLRNTTFKFINNTCIKGFYYRLNELDQFSNNLFYIPKKLDWLSEVQLHSNWKNYTEFKDELNIFLFQKKAPLCWIKFANGDTQKCFVVWW